MIQKIINVETENYLLRCFYGDGAVVEYDFNHIKQSSGTMALPLHDTKYFSKVFIESGSPTWPNGYDLCPEAIYQNGKHIQGPKVAVG